MTSSSPMLWIFFNIGVIALIYLDAFVLNPKDKPMTMRRSVAMTGIWVFLALLFNGAIYF